MERPTPALMIQGTGSNAGKSTIVAGLARALVRRGLKVRAVQAAEHVEQCRRHRSRAARSAARRRCRRGRRGVAPIDPHEPGAAEAGDRYRRASHRAGQALGHAARARLSGAEAAAAAGGAGEFRPLGEGPISSWSKARAARPRSTCAPATSPIWDLPQPPMSPW